MNRLLFLQLPHLDVDPRAESENLMTAALYLRAAALRTPEGTEWEFLRADPEWSVLAPAALAQRIAGGFFDVAVFTLYLWNLERSLAVMSALRRHHPRIFILAGGPEVAEDNHLLLSGALPDVLVIGEGEVVFPGILAGLRLGPPLLDVRVGYRDPSGLYRWGRRRNFKDRRLRELLPAADDGWNQPDLRGVAYLEASRGCPFSCTYCRYNQLHGRVSSIDPGEVKERVQLLAGRGARQIQFIDPTFNRHPRFREILKALIPLRAKYPLTFFCEIWPDTLTADDAVLLAQAGFTEIEVGVQSGQAEVLAAIHRPGRIDRVRQGIGHLTGAGISVVLDLMLGLPAQTREGVSVDLAWARGLRGVRVQLMQTLAIPGSALRGEGGRLGLSVQSAPPYGVIHTRTMSRNDLFACERLFQNGDERSPLSSRRRWVGRRLASLFPYPLWISRTDDLRQCSLREIRGQQRIEFTGYPGWEDREWICTSLAALIRLSPHTLFQFVLTVADEFPLDLLDLMAQRIRCFPRHYTDRVDEVPSGARRSARVILLRLRSGSTVSSSWAEAAEESLDGYFF